MGGYVSTLPRLTLVECCGGPWDGEIMTIGEFRETQNPIAGGYYLVSRVTTVREVRTFETLLIWNPDLLEDDDGA